MTGDCHVRFCEGLGVKFPRATRLCKKGYLDAVRQLKCWPGQINSEYGGTSPDLSVIGLNPHYYDKLTFRRLDLVSDLTVSAGPNSDFLRLIQNSRVPHKTIVRHDIIAGIVIEKYPFFRSQGLARGYGRDCCSCTACAIIFQSMF